MHNTAPFGVIRRPQTLREICVERIEGAIVTGAFAPGDRLNDRNLQEWLGVSRTPIREAMLELERRGLIESKRSSYTRVAMPDPSHTLPLTQALAAALGGAVRVTLPVMREAELAGVTAQLGDVRDAVAQRCADTYRRSRDDLITVLMRACPNRFLIDAVKYAHSRLRFQEVLSHAESAADWGRLLRGYQSLERAVHEHDAVSAELAIELAFALDSA
ncbi:DNA-binding GntR family transcriptional regulator [Microbacterium phyllosphaerae]|uniref:DNA-binding GntR family transcriptional regulator n=1 Tax=Microbacterium phyllosphaerae TaxID=124798 RepID=A0ABS4WL35_9MICO|nr:GntR family transcriptional regulator [Microbacterium phyllosphaerae]MBP2376906.1 DNA-binding GntR family transcriptional regulator [Microbacterium phyllosphaerae]